MKNKVCCFAGAVFCVGVLTDLEASVVEAVNLLKEPEFEDSSQTFKSTANWLWTTNKSPNASKTFSTSQKYAGAQSLRLTYGSTSQSDRYARLSQDVTVNPNSAYEFSAYVKGTGVQGGSIAAGSTWDTRSYFSTGTNDWRYYSLTIDSGSNTTIPFMFLLDNKVTELFIDNAKVTEIFLQNSGFENSYLSPAPWIFATSGTPENLVSASGSVVSGIIGSSGNCFKFTYGTAQAAYNFVSICQTIGNLRPNTSYIAEASIKGTGVGKAAMITGSGWNLRQYFPEGDIPEWSKVIFQFTTDSNPANWPFVIAVESKTTELYVDNVKIYRACDYHSRDGSVGSGNLLSNPSFEKADYGGWGVYQGSSGGNAQGYVTGTQNQKGGKSFVLANNTSVFGPNQFSALLQNVANLTPNTTYRLSAFVKGQDVREGSLIADWTWKANLPFGTYDWTFVSLDFTTGSSQTSLPVGLIAENAMTSIQVDNFTLKALSKTTAPVLSNQDAVSGKGICWHEMDALTMAASGFKWIRRDMMWNQIETTFSGTYNWSAWDSVVAEAEAAGVKLYIILDYGNKLYDVDASGNEVAPYTEAGRQAFANFAQAAMVRYAGKGYVWELYNEPNNLFWKPTPKVADYIALAQKVGQTVRANTAISNECLVMCALAGIDVTFAVPLIESGVASYFDGFSIHPYRMGPPETMDADIRFLQQIVDNGNASRSFPVFIGECGYQEGNSGLDMWGQARYYLRMYMQGLLVKSPLNMWYTGKDYYDSSLGRDETYGLWRADGSPKPSLVAAQTISTYLTGKTFRGRLATSGASDPNAYVLGFDGDCLVVWSSHEIRNITIPLGRISSGTYAVYDSFYNFKYDIVTTSAGLPLEINEDVYYLFKR